jgi:DNA-binding response OmpR family regulator
MPKKAKAQPEKGKSRVEDSGGKNKPKIDGKARANGGVARSFASPADVRLLVVDDEPEVLNLLVPFLKKRGYTVSEAEDGDQALEKILTERPNIVLLDVMMPGLNGWEISQYVRDRPELDPVRIIMATGIGEDMNAATAPLYGADAYIDKPFRLEDVERTVEDVIHRIESGALASRAEGRGPV